MKKYICLLALVVGTFANPVGAATLRCDALMSTRSAVSSAAYERNHCEQFYGNNQLLSLMYELSAKLFYDFEEFCAHPRVLDIFPEVRRIYNQEDDEFYDHQVITLHYNEYSCEYHYNLEKQEWSSRQKCYGTF